jgi:hypothetical protein
MAKVEWSAGIDSVSGALSKPGKNGQHSCSKMLLGTHRVAATENPNCNRVYIRKKTKRSTPVTVREQLARTRFLNVQAAVKARAKNLSTLTDDQAAFEEQKNTAGGKKTWRSYLWKVCGDEYDAQHGA